MWQQSTEATTRLAIRRLMAAYLAIAAVALAFPYRPAAWLPIALLHAFAIAWLLQIGPLAAVTTRMKERWPRASAFISDWYALALIPALYTELATLNVAVHNGHYFDSIIIGWEQSLFGGQPSRELAQTWPSLPVSEFLHFSYISYYLIIYGPPIYLYLKGRRAAHQQVVFTLLLTFFAHYVFFIYFPVQGPRYLFPAPSGEISNGIFYHLAHRLLEAGSSRGAAFPSSHVGVAFAQAALACFTMPRFAPALIVLSSALAVGAVYGGFHYATDAVAGLLFGLFLFAVASRVARRIAGAASR